MVASQGFVYYQQHDQAASFRVEGRCTMTQALPFRRQAESCLAQGCRLIRVDLRDCSHLDSTFLGTLLSLKKQLERHSGRFFLVSPSMACTRILEQMGLLDLLPTESTLAVEDGNWTLLGSDSNDLLSFKRNVVEAHEELAALPGPTGQQFQEVLRCIQQVDPTVPSPAPSVPPINPSK